MHKENENNTTPPVEVKRLRAVILEWHRDKSFGFAAVLDDPEVLEDLFIHSSFIRPGRSFFSKGSIVMLTLSVNPKTGRACGMDVEFINLGQDMANLDGLGRPQAGPLDGLRGNGLGRSLSSLANQNNLTDEDDARGNR
jgi:hypothetical protein